MNESMNSTRWAVRSGRAPAAIAAAAKRSQPPMIQKTTAIPEPMNQRREAGARRTPRKPRAERSWPKISAPLRRPKAEARWEPEVMRPL